MDDDRYSDRGDRDRSERMMRGGNESRWGSRRDWEDDDRDEGYRSTDRYGGGQSGYGAGRFGDDRSMGPGYRNQAHRNRSYDDRQGMHTDDRFTGRGGSQYWDERGDRGWQNRGYDERSGYNYNSGYNQGGMGYGGYGNEGMSSRAGSQAAFRGGGNAGAQYADDYNRGRGMGDRGDFDQGMGYGHGHGFGLGQGMGHQGERQGGPMGTRGYYGQGGVGGGYPAMGHGDQSRQGYGGMQGNQGPHMTSGYSGGTQGGYAQQTGYGEPGGQSHRGKGPQGYTRSDDRIKEQVCEALSDDDHIDATHIEVVVKNGEVMLTGVVDDRRQKRLAEDLVERLPGVKDVQNQLRVGRPHHAGSGNQNTGSAVGRTETETSTTSSDKKHRA